MSQLSPYRNTLGRLAYYSLEIDTALRTPYLSGMTSASSKL
jgi:hypothetical protein